MIVLCKNLINNNEKKSFNKRIYSIYKNKQNKYYYTRIHVIVIKLHLDFELI